MAFNFQTFGQSTTAGQSPVENTSVSNPSSSPLTNVVNVAGEISGTKPWAKGIGTILTMGKVQKIQDKILEDHARLSDYLTKAALKAKAEGNTQKANKISGLLKEQIQNTTGPTLMQSYTKETVPTAKEIMGGTITMGTWLLSPSMPSVEGWTQKAILSRAALSAPIGVSAGLGNALMKDKNTPNTIKEMATGGITAAVLSFGIDEVVNGIRWAVSKLPAIVSYTSEVPQETLQYVQEHPKEVAEARKSLQGLTPQQQADKITSMTQQAIKGMRQDLTHEWETRFNQAIQENTGVKIGLSNYEEQLLNKVNNIVPLENLPSNTASMSLKEAHDLYSQIEDIASKSKLYETAEGVPVRMLLDKLKNKMISSFGGKGSTFAVLLNDYSTKKQILDSANSLAKAWPIKPQDYAAASNNLTKVFNNDKFSYLDAIQKLEQNTGKSLLDYIAAWNTNSLLPYRHGGFDLDEMIRIVLSPLTSPRITSEIIRGTSGLQRLGEGTVSQFGRTAGPILSTQIMNGLNNRIQQ